MLSKMYALTRYDIEKDGSVLFNDFMSRACQDTWIFEPPVPHQELETDFPMGKPGCDNRIMYEFKSLGWNVLNSSRKIVTRHLHCTQKRNYTKSDTLKGSYAVSNPTDQL